MMANESWRFGPLTIEGRHVGNVTQSGGVNTTEKTVLDENPAVDQQSNSQATLDSALITLKGPRASERARELAEFFRSAGSQPFALSTVAANGAGLDGYYITTSAERDPILSTPEEGSKAAEQISLRSMARAGTQQSHWLGLATNPSEPDVSHGFGTAEEALVGVPASATKVQAIDAAIGPSERTSPTPEFTAPSEFGGVDVYDALAIGFDNPIFLYNLPYDEAAKVDVNVYDTLGNADKFDTSGSTAIRQWQHIFNPAHDPDGPIVLDNGLLRVRLDEANGTIEAEGFDDGSYGAGPYGAGPYGGYENPDNADVWHDALIGAADWSLLDANLTHISPVRVEAQLIFENDTDGSLYAVDVQLGRGAPSLKVWVPKTVSDPIPSGLADLFDPIASESTWDPVLSRTLINRKEVQY